MSRFHQKYVGTQYAPTAAALIGATIFVPVLLAASRPVGYLNLSLALFGSCLCLVTAWLSWDNANLTIPTLEAPVVRVR